MLNVEWVQTLNIQHSTFFRLYDAECGDGLQPVLRRAEARRHIHHGLFRLSAGQPPWVITAADSAISVSRLSTGYRPEKHAVQYSRAGSSPLRTALSIPSSER